MAIQKIKVGYIDANGSVDGQAAFSNGSSVYWANTTQNLTVRYANDAIAFSGMGTGTAYVANAAGSNTQVQFNDSGAFLGSAGLTFNTSSNALFSGGTLTFGAGSNIGAPTTNTRSIGTKVIAYDNLSNTSVDYAVGVENAHMWFSTSSTVAGFKWYANTTNMIVANTTGFIPGASNTYDLGTTSLRWKTIYTNDLELSNGIGDYTIVEGEDDLFIYNNKKGKVYKFALIEVDPSEAPPKAK